MACIYAAALPAQAADLNLCWVGGGGHTMTGHMTISDRAMTKPIVTEADVTGFKIAGYRDGNLLGTWDMADSEPGTTWFLRFFPQTLTFPTGGQFSGPRSQGWNADGTAQNCGNPGFGFNSGSYAQDICVNGVYIRLSSIDPFTPLIATAAPVTPDCGASSGLSKSGSLFLTR